MQPAPITKYRPFPPVHLPDRQWPNRVHQRAPVWCSVDLRDGNQALAIPMSVEEKLEFFDLLVRVGFKEIEIGFPSASETEFAFCRALIEQDRIPAGVSVQVLTQAREHLIRRTFEALRGARRAIVHLYNSTNPLQRRVTFGLSRAEVKALAVQGARLVRDLTPSLPETDVRYEYSPESFTDTELEFALEVCEAVAEVWQPTPARPMIMNLPATVELATPNVHADQIEWFCRHLRDRASVLVSLHTHNDRGTGQAATELGLLAGADRVEGTLFGNGERTGNLDLVTTALNLYTHGIDPGLDFSRLPAIRETYERLTRMTVHERHPYAGDLVFTAFSGSHQDAIKKGMDARDPAPGALWAVPYLPVDPTDLGRTYDAIIRVNSQSGKGGVAYLLQAEFGLDLPKKMHPEVAAAVQKVADATGREVLPADLRAVFAAEFLNLRQPLLLADYETSAGRGGHPVRLRAEAAWNGAPLPLAGEGNGPIAALVDALARAGHKFFRLLDFKEHAVARGSAAEAAAYVCVERLADGRQVWGAALDTNIERAALHALVSAVNRAAG